MASTPSSAPKSATKKSISTEIVIGKAAADLNKAVAEIQKATSSIADLEKRAEDLSLQIANKEAQIEELNLKFKEEQRQMALDLELKMKQDAETTVTDYLKSKGRQSISVTEYTEMTSTITNSRAEAEKHLNSEVAKAVAIAKANHEAAIKLLEASHKADQATNAAKIQALENQVKFHENQSNIWKEQLEAEREASVERAKAGSIGNINLGSSDPGRR